MSIEILDELAQSIQGNLGARRGLLWCNPMNEITTFLRIDLKILLLTNTRFTECIGSLKSIDFLANGLTSSGVKASDQTE